MNDENTESYMRKYRDIGDRVNAIESDVSELKIGQGRTNIALEAQSKTLSHYGNVLDRISDKIGNKETDWKTLISAVALVVAIGGAILFPIKESITTNTNKLEQIHERISFNGWSKQDQQRFEDAFDKRLQMEMRLLNDATKADMQNLDTVLQREMALNDEILEQKMTGLEKIVKEIMGRSKE